MTNDEKLMQQALDALEHAQATEPIWKTPIREAKEALRARLAQPEPAPTNNGRYLTGYKAQPEPEPVAWVDDEGGAVDFNSYVPDPGTPLYTAPPQRSWQGLTDEEITEAAMGTSDDELDFAYAIEAKLKEKNNG